MVAGLQLVTTFLPSNVDQSKRDCCSRMRDTKGSTTRLIKDYLSKTPLIAIALIVVKVAKCLSPMHPSFH